MIQLRSAGFFVLPLLLLIQILVLMRRAPQDVGVDNDLINPVELRGGAGEDGPAGFISAGEGGVAKSAGVNFSSSSNHSKADYMIVILSDKKYFAQALVLVDKIHGFLTCSSVRVDLGMILSDDVPLAARSLLQARFPTLIIHNCSGLGRKFPTVHYCKFDLFLSDTFRQRRSVLYVDADHFLLDGSSLLKLLLQESRDKIYRVGVPHLSMGRDFTDARKVEREFGKQIAFSTRIIRFDPRKLPENTTILTRIESAIKKWGSLSKYWEQGVLNALFVREQGQLDVTLTDRALHHTYHVYNPRKEVAFAVMFKAAAGFDFGARLGCSFFEGGAREIFECKRA